MLLATQSATTLLGIYPKELKTDVHPKACTFVIATAWEPRRRPSSGDWVRSRGPSRQWDTLQHCKGRSHRAVTGPGGAQTPVPARQKPVWKAAVSLRPCDVPEKAGPWGQRKGRWLPWAGEDGGGETEHRTSGQ